MGDIARCSVGKPSDFHNEDLLYKLFGVNAELLIDHAWGFEPCTMAEIKAYRPESNSISSGQVQQGGQRIKAGCQLHADLIHSLMYVFIQYHQPALQRNNPQDEKRNPCTNYKG